MHPCVNPRSTLGGNPAGAHGRRVLQFVDLVVLLAAAPNPAPMADRGLLGALAFVSALERSVRLKQTQGASGERITITHPDQVKADAREQPKHVPRAYEVEQDRGAV